MNSAEAGMVRYCLAATALHIASGGATELPTPDELAHAIELVETGGTVPPLRRRAWRDKDRRAGARLVER